MSLLLLCVYCVCVYVFPCTASAKAFDQYGKLTEDLEEQMEMRERAETMALEVLQYTYMCYYVCNLFFSSPSLPSPLTPSLLLSLLYPPPLPPLPPPLDVPGE